MMVDQIARQGDHVMDRAAAPEGKAAGEDCTAALVYMVDNLIYGCGGTEVDNLFIQEGVDGPGHQGMDFIGRIYYLSAIPIDGPGSQRDHLGFDLFGIQELGQMVFRLDVRGKGEPHSRLLQRHNHAGAVTGGVRDQLIIPLAVVVDVLGIIDDHGATCR